MGISRYLYTDGTDNPGFHGFFYCFGGIRLFPWNPYTAFPLKPEESSAFLTYEERK